MKVLWFSNTPACGDEVLRVGGTRGGWLSSLDKALRDKVRLSVAFYYARYAEPFVHKDVSYYPICRKNWKLNIIKNNLFGDFVDKEDLHNYLEIIKKVQPDVIHIHGTENPFGALLGVCDVPIVVSYQGSSTVYNHKFFSGIEKNFASMRGTNIFSPHSWIFNKSFNYNFKKSTQHREREAKNLKHCKILIGRTDWDRRITRILAPESIYCHNDEILRNKFYEKIWKRPDNKKKIIHSTSGEALFKGFETVCQALNELNKKGLNVEWRVAGVSKDGLLNKVVKRKMGASYPLKGLSLLGNLNEQELINKMLESDIFVLPSHIDNSPNNLCEAMLIGMPCISTYVGGTPSLLTDKQDGILIQDGDPWSMAGAIIELFQDHELAQRYGHKARERALIRHNPERIVDDLINIYQRAISNNKK